MVQLNRPPILIAVALTLAIGACGTPAADTTTPGPAVTTTAAAAAATSMTPDMSMTDEEHEDDAEHETETTEHSDENSSVTDPAEVDREIVVIMTEFAFEPESVEVAAGETIRFVANNEGVIEHEIRFTTHHAAQEHIAAGHDDHEAEPDGHHEEMLLTVQPGASGDLVVAFDVADEFEIMACLLPGHFEAGMVADIVAR